MAFNWKKFNFLQFAIEFLLPRFCLLCNKRIVHSNSLVCDSCANEFTPAEPPESIMRMLNSSLGSEVHFDAAFCLWKFEGKVQTLIHHLKYNEFWSIGKFIAGPFADRLQQLGIDERNSLLVPVPLHKTRLRERGYNQAEILCHFVTANTSIPTNSSLIKRIRYTSTQTQLSLEQRKRNVTDAFAVDERQQLLHKTVILVDDVLTTGATTNACAKELRKLNPRNIWVFTVAKA